MPTALVSLTPSNRLGEVTAQCLYTVLQVTSLGPRVCLQVTNQPGVFFLSTAPRQFSTQQVCISSTYFPLLPVS